MEPNLAQLSGITATPGYKLSKSFDGLLRGIDF